MDRAKSLIKFPDQSSASNMKHVYFSNVIRFYLIEITHAYKIMYLVRFQVMTVVSMKTVFWIVVSHGLEVVYRCRLPPS